MDNVNERLITIFGFITIMFFISKCTEVEKHRHLNTKPLLIQKQ